MTQNCVVVFVDIVLVWIFSACSKGCPRNFSTMQVLKLWLSCKMLNILFCCTQM